MVVHGAGPCHRRALGAAGAAYAGVQCFGQRHGAGHRRTECTCRPPSRLRALPGRRCTAGIHRGCASGQGCATVGYAPRCGPCAAQPQRRPAPWARTAARLKPPVKRPTPDACAYALCHKRMAHRAAFQPSTCRCKCCPLAVMPINVFSPTFNPVQSAFYFLESKRYEPQITHSYLAACQPPGL